MAPRDDDPFDDLLTLEDTLYTTAHNQGIADGARAGRIEGRIFGLEKGFEKFAALGELHGRGAVWGARISARAARAAEPTSTTITTSSFTQPEEPSIKVEKDSSNRSSATPPPHPKAKIIKQLPQIHHTSTRLQSNISLLYHLTDPLTFSTSNTEVDVGDFDDRFKRAGAKTKVVERIIGETSTTAVQMSTIKNSKSTEEDSKSGTGKARNVRLEGEGKKGGKKWDDSMEDFGGSRLIK